MFGIVNQLVNALDSTIQVAFTVASLVPQVTRCLLSIPEPLVHSGEHLTRRYDTNGDG